MGGGDNFLPLHWDFFLKKKLYEWKEGHACWSLSGRERGVDKSLHYGIHVFSSYLWNEELFMITRLGPREREEEGGSIQSLRYRGKPFANYVLCGGQAELCMSLGGANTIKPKRKWRRYRRGGDKGQTE